MRYIVFGPAMTDEEFDAKIAEDNRKLDEMEAAHEKLMKEIRELLKNNTSVRIG